jgi:neurotransmitter:Na+ symporter, NSS family
MATEAKTARAEWGSRFGFLMAMIGAMVGVGNIWRFPFVTGENGGGAFILAFLILLFLVMIPGLMAEVALGKYAGKGVIGSIRDATGPGAAAGLGVIVLIVNIALMTYYSPVVGWTLYYMVHSYLFTFTAAGFEAGGFLDALFANPALMIGLHTAVMAIIATILYLGISNGVERLVVYAVPALVLGLAVIAIRAVTLPGAAEGLVFTFTVEWEYLTFAQTWQEALAQALFSTGLGWGIAITVGSYLREYDDAPLGGGVFTAVGEASIGVLAAFAIFPLVFAFGVDPASGAGLTFEALPQVFIEMPGGALWAIVFFTGFFLAALTSAVVITEVGVTTVSEETRLSREQSVLGVCGVIWVLGLPSAYSVEILEFGDDTFALWGLPLATIAILVAVGWFMGPERLRVLSLNQNAGIHVGRWWNPLVKYVVPLTMVFIMAVFAWEFRGEDIMIAGMVMLVGVPLISFAVMRYVDSRAEPQAQAEVTGGDR